MEVGQRENIQMPNIQMPNLRMTNAPLKMTAKRSNIYRKNEAPKGTTPQESNREATFVFLQIFDAVGIIFNRTISRIGKINQYITENDRKAVEYL